MTKEIHSPFEHIVIIMLADPAINRYSILKLIWVLKWVKWKGNLDLETSAGLKAINMKVFRKTTIPMVEVDSFWQRCVWRRIKRKSCIWNFQFIKYKSHLNLFLKYISKIPYTGLSFYSPSNTSLSEWVDLYHWYCRFSINLHIYCL